MNELQIFTSKEFGDIRTVENGSNPLFVGVDVARMLGYSKPANALTQHCRSTLKRGIPHPQNPDKQIEVLCVPFGDVLRLIAASKLPGAMRFESWIFDEVMPSIMRTGRYAVPEKRGDASLAIAEQLLIAAKNQEQRITTLESKQAALEVAVSQPTKTWLETTRERIEGITGKKIKHSGLFLAQFYHDVEKSANALLLSRVNRKKAKMKKRGATKTELEQITKLWVIAQDGHLREVAENILDETRLK